jgi:tRNA threonylcarbamoyl adenosine modification protein YeaZ
MRGDLRILAFDTSGPWCAAALLIGDRIVAARHEEMTKGQAERLMPMLDEVMAEEGAVWEELDAIGVGVGPGNFTGIRISVSAARGLALGLSIPAVGVSGFEAIRHRLGVTRGPNVTIIGAPRNQIYWEHVSNDTTVTMGLSSCADLVCHTYLEPPAVINLSDRPHSLDRYLLGGIAIDCDAPGAELRGLSTQVATAIAEIAVVRLAESTEIPRPSPLYIRPADAAPASDPPPVILP